jgi:hypothetical protein
MLSFFLDNVLKLSKSDGPKPKTEVSSFFKFAKFGHQH